MFIEDYSPHSVDDALRVVLSLFGTRIDRRPPPRPSASDRVARVAAEKQRDAAAVTPGAVRARGYTRGIVVAAGMAAGVAAAAAELAAMVEAAAAETAAADLLSQLDAEDHAAADAAQNGRRKKKKNFRGGNGVGCAAGAGEGVACQ